ncbi:MAG: transporter [Microbacteriaceae bacterium]|jgi:DHA1 family inner membrane transport protein|nr:transporter [Microbacteriaceae bacterium]HEV7956030.1 MFS transporter [Marisediminicola sp.]
MSVPSTPSVQAPPFPWLGLFILAGAIFVCVTSEFLPTGLLPELAEGLGVSESRVGLLVTVYAGTVVLSAPLLTSLTRRVPRKVLVVVVLGVFAITNIVVAVAPTYEVVVVARVAGGLAHGLFWAVVGAYAGYLVPKEQLARAVAVTSAGATAAFVLGVPLGTALGNALGWQLAFLVMAIAVIVLTVLVIFFLPPVRHVLDLRTGEIPLPARKDHSVPGVVVLCTIVAVLMIGQNLFYTYIVPYYRLVAGFSEGSVSVLLFVYGGAGAVGLVLVGIVGARYPRASLAISFATASVAVAVIGLFPEQTVLVVVMLVIWGIAFGGGPALLQTRMLHTASVRVRDLASAWFTVSFNVGIGGGALIGGLIYDGIGLWYLPFFETAVVAAAVVLIVVSDRVQHRRRVTVGRPKPLESPL